MVKESDNGQIAMMTKDKWVYVHQFEIVAAIKNNEEEKINEIL